MPTRRSTPTFRTAPYRRSSILTTLSFVVAAGGAHPATADDGDLDPSFGTHAEGRTIVYFDQGNGNADAATAITVDPATGNLFIGGTVAFSAAESPGYGIAKLSPLGSAVAGFGNLGSGRMAFTVSGREVEPLAVTLDGMGAPGLVGAAPSSGADPVRFFVLHANAAGTSDSSTLFGLPYPGGNAEPYVYDATVDDAGRILLCGLTVLGGDSVAFVARLTSAGTPDTSFGDSGSGWTTHEIIDPSQGATWCESVAVDREGRILTLLHGLNYSTLQAFGAVERRGSDGITVDTGFGAAGLVIINVRPDNQAELLTDLAVSNYGDIFVVGYAQGPGSASSQTAIFRLVSGDGMTVTNFEFYKVPIPPQTYTRFELTRAVIDPAGRLVAGGTLVEGSAPVEHRMAVVRFSSPFTLDASFGTGGFAFVSFTDVTGFSRERADLEDFIVTPDSRFLLAGRALYGASGNNYDFAVARLENAALFLDGFETGDPNRWSFSSP